MPNLIHLRCLSQISIFFLFFIALIERSNADIPDLFVPAIANCDVFDPFKVLPENSRYQIGGAFALHEKDCLKLKSGSVHEIVAVQFALSHWNQKTQNSNSLLGFFAGDSCSRPKEAISQTLRFLDTLGYHEPKECTNNKNSQKNTLIGLISPKDAESTIALAQVLKTTPEIPLASFSLASTEELIKNQFSNIITTAPTISTYVQAFIRLLSLLNKSTLVAIVDEGENSPFTSRVTQLLKANGIFVAEIIAYEHPLLSKILVESDAKIILSLVPNRKMKNVKLSPEMLASRKVWTTLFLEDGVEIPDEVDFLSAEKVGTNIQLQVKFLFGCLIIKLINIRPRFKEHMEFETYFQRVLQNNFDSFLLLRTYAEQVYNCSITFGNSVKLAEACKHYKKQQHLAQPTTIEPILKMVYALASVAERISTNSTMKTICQLSTSADCHEQIASELLNLDYKFDDGDPMELQDDIPLRFHRNSDRIIMQSGLRIDVQLLERQGRDGVIIYKVGFFSCNLQILVN